MTEQESREREAVVAEEMTWLGTPYHENAAIKGAGVDCIRFIQQCFINTNLIEPFVIPWHSPQWAMHQKSELLLEGILKYSHEVEVGFRGDVALFRFGHCWGHSAIIDNWP